MLSHAKRLKMQTSVDNPFRMPCADGGLMAATSASRKKPESLFVMAVQTNILGSQSLLFTGPLCGSPSSNDALRMRVMTGGAIYAPRIRVERQRDAVLSFALFHPASNGFAWHHEMVRNSASCKTEPSARMGLPWVTRAADPRQIPLDVEFTPPRVRMTNIAGMWFYFAKIRHLVMGIPAFVVFRSVTGKTEIETFPIWSVSEEQGVQRLLSFALFHALGFDIVAGRAI